MNYVTEYELIFVVCVLVTHIINLKSPLIETTYPNWGLNFDFYKFGPHPSLKFQQHLKSFAISSS